VAALTATAIDGFASATKMLGALRAHQISAVELLELHLRRIERYTPSLNAIVTQDFDNARRTAAAADAARARGEDRPLLGLPITIKDGINVRGLATTLGTSQWADYRAEEDAPLVARARAAGAVIMGKTNVPPMLMDWTTDNPVFGRTNNPWDLGRTPGGSTGGGAAALAAGLTPLEYGSDIGGSIRVPAAFCGVYGHKPSETALPRSGSFPGPSLPNPAARMAVQGPLTRSAEDLELAFDVVAGPEIGEEVAWRLEMPAARHGRLGDFRVAVLPRIPWLPVDDEILATLEEQARKLSRIGAQVKEALPEDCGDLRHFTETYWALLSAVSTARLPADTRGRVADRLRTSEDEFDRARLRGIEASAGDYLALHREREQYRAAYRAFFRDWDILLAPATIVPAFLHPDRATPQHRRTLAINGASVSYELQLAPAGLASLPGQPSTAFPVGLTAAARLPIGLQAIGPYLEDRTPIHFAALCEKAWGGFRPPPGYDAMA
jgi:amidase